MSKVLLILGPYDRYNYGDLLFPYMIENELKDFYDEIRYFSTTKSDLSNVGGKKTESFKELSKLDSSNKYTLIVAGGESLIVTWGWLCSYIYPKFNDISIIFRITRKVFGEITHFKFHNYVGKKWLRGKTYLPLSVSKKELKNIERVYYNSLGGSGLSDIMLNQVPQLKKIYQNVDYLSIRDEKTNSTLNRNNIKSSLCPDSAILLSKYYTTSLLKSKVSETVKENVSANKNYFFFQVSKHGGITHLDIIVEQLEKLYYKTKIKICLCPIGIALGHEDFYALNQIDKLLKVPHFSFSEKINIWEIMYIIASSKLYIGTSLHGAITAMSYNTPYLGLEIPKLDFYLKTWGVTELNSAVKFEELADSAIKAIQVDSKKLEENLEYQTKVIEESFDKMK